MGVFDNKDDATKSTGFSDVTADSSQSSQGSSAPADFSDVTAGSSSTAPAASTTYTVKSGDSLSHIAKHIYGDASKWHQIYEANRDKIKNPDLIQPGWVLNIPSA